MNNIIEIEGDLLNLFELSSDIAIAHVCNCCGVMGSGIALSIKTRFPSAYDNYKKYEKDYGLTLGTISTKLFPSNRCIINLHAQQNYGRGKQHLDYIALRFCLSKTREVLLGNNIKLFAIPHRMGSDRAGGDWNTVLKIVSEELNELQVTVVKLLIPI